MADNQAFIDALTAALQGVVNAAAPPPNFAATLQQAMQDAITAAGAHAPAAGPFSLHPATATANVIDYNTSHGKKLYDSAVSSLFDEGSQYVLDDPDNDLLIENLSTRATQNGWEAILTVNTAHGPDNLLESYGAITRPEIEAHVQAILANDDRARQNDTQVLVCMQNSVDASTKSTMATAHADWRIQPAGAAPADPKLNSGILYLFTILAEKSEVKARALCSHIKTKLGSMDKIMLKEAKQNIKKFNKIIDEHNTTLRKHRDPLSQSDLLTFMFKGYLACSDQDFLNTIKAKKDQYELDGANILPEQLKQVALNKYEVLLLVAV